MRPSPLLPTLLAVMLVAAGTLPGQTAEAQAGPTASVARPQDVATIDGIMHAFYDVISGPAGQPRQWSRDSTLYIADVRFVAMRERDGRPVADVMDHGEFARRTDASLGQSAFYEIEIGRTERRFGNLAHVFSAYEYRTAKDGPVLGRGVNSVQLYWDGDRWWITNVVWDDERPGNPIPAELLGE